MKIEEGRTYVDGNGDKHGPMLWDDGGWFYVKGRLGCWYRSGQCEDSATARSIGPLVAEWTDGPVRTVTRREVVPGVYGVVHVDEGANTPFVVSMRGTRRPDELRAAAAVLLELAGALDSE